MKLLKWIIVFTVAFIAAWIIIFTFIQEPFKVQASAKLLSYTTPPIPIFMYVFFAFVLGVVLGLGAAVFNWATMKQELHRAKKRIRELERGREHDSLPQTSFHAESDETEREDAIAESTLPERKKQEQIDSAPAVRYEESKNASNGNDEKESGADAEPPIPPTWKIARDSE